MKTLDDIDDLQGKTVFLRADFDVPVVEGVIQESFRIERQREGLHRLIDGGARVVIGAHISAVPSFAGLLGQLESLLGTTLAFGSVEGPVKLLENLRTDPGEEANDPFFAQKILSSCDLYVNNAFAVCHRAHASVDAAAHILPAYAGPVIVEETRQLARALDAAPEGKVIFMGGAKASTKVPVIKNLMDRTEAIAVGGVIANDVMKVQGFDIRKSRVDEDAAELLAGVDVRDPKLHIPIDQVWDEDQMRDIGSETAQNFAELARNAKTIIWNGPMGKFEEERFLSGTAALAYAIADSSAYSVIGGGDTITAVHMLGIDPTRFSFVSTGGGAMLSFLGGNELPGLKALGYYPA